jgi:hypothetical protein
VRAMKKPILVMLAAGALSSCSSAPVGTTAQPTQGDKKVEPAAGGARSMTRLPGAPEGTPEELAAQTEASALAPEVGPRIAATGPHVWIMPEANAAKGQIALGDVRMGTSIKLRSEQPVQGYGCERGWYAIEPRGYVCLGPRTTLDLNDPYYLALRDVAPKRGELYPYSYAHSCGAPMYSRVPTPDEWKEAESALGKAGYCADLGKWADGHEELMVDTPIEASGPVPWYFENGKRHVSGGGRSSLNLVWKTIPNGSMLSYARSFEMHGRVWLVAPDLTIVPADRVKMIKRHSFQGVKLGDGVELPIAWNRHHDDCAVYKKKEGGGYEPTGETLGGKKWLMIVDKRHESGKDGYFELKDRAGLYLREKDITVSRKRKKLPPAIKPGERWIDAHITPGTITLYDDMTPVYATLFSPGKGGHPVPGNDHSRYATTQTGYFRFEWKELVATMSNEQGDPTVLWFSDVPHIQYVRAPLAMHVAFWHEDFGNPKSAECLNMSAEDGRFLFGWTEPKVPEDWNAVRPGGGFGTSTPIMINGFWID